MDDDRPPRRTGVDEVVRGLLQASYGLHPDDLPRVTTELIVEHVPSARDVTLLFVDLDQVLLQPLHEGPAHGVEDTPAGQAFREEQPVVDQRGDCRQVWLPILDSAERVGVLGVVDDGSTPLEDWLVLASLLGELIVSKASYGDAISLVRRRHDVSLAAEMRWALLPPLTFSSPRVCVAGILQPSHGVAGDAFDYAVNGSTAIVGIFDAMGHGLQASRLANLAVGGFRHGRRRGLRADRNLTTMDADLAEQFGRSVFVTGQIITLDLDTGLTTIVTAGHPPPAVLRLDGPPEAVDVAPGRPLGLGPSRYDETTVALQPGDALLLLSDGTYEARGTDGEEYGWERLVAAAQVHLDAGRRPAEILRLCIRDLMAFQGTDVRDDATLVMVRYQPSAIGEPTGPRADRVQLVSG